MTRRRTLRSFLLPFLAALAGCGDGSPADTSAPKAEDRPPIETYPVRQILVTTAPSRGWPDAPKRSVEDARARAQAAYERLVRGEDFARVAADTSDDPTTREDGGFVGFVGRHLKDREDLVRVVAALPVDGVTRPIETDGAFFVLQRLSRAEGMAIEARVAAPIDGFLVQWHEMVPSLPESQTREEAYAEAAAALTDLRSGAKTQAEVEGRILGARNVSLGLRRHSPPGYEKAAAAVLATEPGTWTGPVETREGWLVARRLPYERIALSHILVGHRLSPGRLRVEKRSEPEAMARAREALERLRKDPASWDAVVREYSDDPSTRDRGGRLGDACNVEGATRRPPPEVEAEAGALAPGAISDVVPGRLGVHIIRRDP